MKITVVSYEKVENISSLVSFVSLLTECNSNVKKLSFGERIGRL